MARMATADGTVITSVEQLKTYVGKETRVGEWHLVTQEEINQFADATGDHQWIHVDIERAKTGPFKGTIAHGYWTLSAASFLLRGGEGITVRLPSRMGINYGLNRLRFPSPVPAGSSVRGTFTLNDLKTVEGGVQALVGFEVRVDGATKPAAAGEAVFNYYL